MKRQNASLIHIMSLIAVLVFAGCSSDNGMGPQEDQGPAITRVWIEGGLIAPLDGSAQLKAFVLLEDGTQHDVTDDAAWDTLDPAVATASKGEVHGVAVGVTQVRIRYRGVTFTDFLGVPTRGNPQGSITLEGYSGVDQVLQFSYQGETRQLKIEIRYPDATTKDITDRVVFESSNPAAISVDAFGMATVNVAQGATELYVTYRNQFVPFTLQVGDPLPETWDVYVEATYIGAPYSCDSATNADGGDGEFCYQLNVVSPSGDRLIVDETPSYPDHDGTINIDQNGSLNLQSDQLHLRLSEIQTLEIEVRVTEWDLQWTDFGDPIPDSDLDDVSVRNTYRGSDSFEPGVHYVTINGATSDCEVKFGYRIIVVK